MSKDYPVGKAQQIILDALGLEASSFQEADEIFEKHGLAVIAVRQGRRSVPQVKRLPRFGGGFNIHGEGEAWENEYKPVELSKISEYLKT